MTRSLLFWTLTFLTFAVIHTSVVSIGFAQQGVPLLSVAGHWQGVLTAGQQSLSLVFHFHAIENGKWIATMDSPDQGAFRIPAANIVVAADKITGEWNNLQAKLDAKLSNDGKKLEGTWTQGVQIAAKLERVENNRPQEPMPPYPYAEQEVVIHQQAAGFDLAGTLTIPAGSGPFPAIVMLTGSGRRIAMKRSWAIRSSKSSLMI